MRFKGLARRNFFEIVRDPLPLVLGLVFPAALLLLLYAISASVPAGEASVFEMSRLAPGIALFGFCFIMMFSAMQIAKDRRTAFFDRLQTLPLKPFDFILGYALPFLPIALFQIVFTYILAFILGLGFSWGVLLSIPYLLPIAIFFIGIGLILGCCCSENQISGIGTILINFCAIFSGTWFPIEMVGGALKTIAYVMPFARAVDGAADLINGAPFSLEHLLITLTYSIVSILLGVFIFYKKLKGKSIHQIHNKKLNEHP